MSELFEKNRKAVDAGSLASLKVPPHSVEAEQAAHLACKSAGARTGGQVLALHRDLFRSPLQPAELNRFDAVLLDAPCSATGTCRRHPDVLHRIGPRQIAELTEFVALVEQVEAEESKAA